MQSQRKPQSAVSVSESGNRSFLRQSLLLATVIFLIVAPALDAQLIAEISANFISG
jgi:hypothetical protein